MVVGCVVIPLLLLIAGVISLVIMLNRDMAELTIPAGDIAFVYTIPDEEAPLLARFGAGQALAVTGRTEDWRWLEVNFWDGQSGWIKRPLDILVWKIDANVTAPIAPETVPTAVSPIISKMITIPASSFTMGSPPSLGDGDESPAHTVQISTFAIDRTEVTVGQYWQCVSARECTAPVSQTSNHYVNDPAFDNHPMIFVPWAEARAYCTWQGKRLPTEAEWELAASWNSELGAKNLWPWGNDASSALANVGDGRVGKTAVVGSFLEDISPAGVLDMGGNVQEWVLDWYKSDYYRIADETNPQGPSYRRGEGSGRSVRGGSYADENIAQARTANRNHADEKYGQANIGFRCVQDDG